MYEPRMATPTPMTDNVYFYEKRMYNLQIATIVLVVLSLVASLRAWTQVTRMETMKVWGKENFEKLQKIMGSEEYKEQYSQSLELMLQQLNWSFDDSNLGQDYDDSLDMAKDDENDIVTWDSAMINTDNSTGQDEQVLEIMDQNELSGS